MSRFSRYSLALLATRTVSSGAYARVNHSTPSIQPGARASAVGTSEADIRRQCADEARARWGTTNQDMQKNRDFAASTCMSNTACAIRRSRTDDDAPDGRAPSEAHCRCAPRSAFL